MTASSSTRKTVVVACDTPFVRDRFKIALESAGHRALVVKSVAQLLAHVRADADDLHLLVADLKFGGTPGADVVRRIRKLVKEYDVRAVSFFPSGSYPQVAINAKEMYVIYAACIDLDLPVFINAGQAARAFSTGTLAWSLPSGSLKPRSSRWRRTTG